MSEGFKPPFDLFGTSPTFYVKRKKKNMTWLGCFCSILMYVSIITVFYTYFRSFMNKVQFQLVTTTTNNEEHPRIDLMTKDQMLLLEHYPVLEKISQYVIIEVFHVKENKFKKQHERRPLRHFPCKETTFQGKPINFERTCVKFEEPTEIGADALGTE